MAAAAQVLVVELEVVLMAERKRLGVGEPRVALGNVAQTPGVEQAVPKARALECLARHQAGEWGLMCEDDPETNEANLKAGGFVMSSWAIDPEKPSTGIGDNTLWIITERVGLQTTILLPDEY